MTILWRPSHLYMEFKGAVNQERILQHSSSGDNLPSSHTQPQHHPYLSNSQSDFQQPPPHIQTQLLHTHTHIQIKNEAQGHNLHGRNVFSRKGICGVTDQQAGLPYSSAKGKRDKHKEGYSMEQ